MAKRSVPVTTADEANGTEADGSRTLIEQAYLRLRNDIVEGRLAPGERMRVEHLKSHYEVGAGTLREAITRLVSDALVVTEGQRGFRVAPATLEDLADLTRLRLHIEIEALRQSMRLGGPAWRDELAAVYAELSALEQPLDPGMRRSWEMLNARFHETLIAACASPWTLKVLRTLSRHSERYRRFSIGLSAGDRDVHAEHRLIYESAISGQEARAALALEVHIRATLDVLSKARWNDGDVPRGV